MEAPTLAHAPKRETFNLADYTNTDPKGFVRPVDHYHIEPWGLYMGRESDHEQFHYLESWILPSLSIRVSVFHFYPAHERDQNFYVDIGQFTAGETAWRSEDHYIDVVLRTGRGAHIEDIDELFDAHTAGYISTDRAEAAVRTSVEVMTKLALYKYSLSSWLQDEGMAITWR
ncbi:DUF402 domain-containing protein [Hoyosella rhizosphaerae]|uniref:DUF402 domain-containing protein n=1 Tax=Hoyosella rhizosphaerae TaxID=1755582 RepID=A0A916UFF6_9ACTN|nr:DUF402 domain-containing protein [Hoyosella rhizosphaerae]MBN4925514.1 DUF402 domain-containing protein [Hoyosella rhizosphaerae]GGC70028.1 hypothetical protein GCM10011410_23600 [Hoyosella rhizosphaerae]